MIDFTVNYFQFYYPLFLVIFRYFSLFVTIHHYPFTPTTITN